MSEELSFTHGGHSYRCWVESAKVSAAPPPAISSNAFWCAEVDGMRYRLFEASYDDLYTPAKRMALERRITNAVAGQESRTHS